MLVYPLIFEPIYKPKIWGARRLEGLVGKTLPGSDAIGESWELADLENGQSVVSCGPSKGKTLGELVGAWGEKLLGGAKLFEGRFPLLIKFLDASEPLSVQVHPDDAMAASRGGACRVKNEAWYVVDAEADGCIYRGFKAGVDAAGLRAAIEAGTVEAVLNRIPVRKGHAYYLPSGTIHALGAGVTVAEVQTPSDMTFRFFDWGRVDPSTGVGRELHVEDALSCVSFSPVPLETESPQHLASVWTAITSLIRCESFVIERVRIVEGAEIEIPHLEMVIWIVLEGRGSIRCDGIAEPVEFGVGDTVLIPAGVSGAKVTAHASTMWLEVTVPIGSTLADFDRPDSAALQQSQQDGGRYVELKLPRQSQKE